MQSYIKKIVIITALSLVLYFILPSKIFPTFDAYLLLPIFFFTAVSWITEPVKPHITSIISVLVISLLYLVPWGFDFSNTYEISETIKPIFSPVILVLFGGLLISVMFTKYKLDKKFVNLLIKHLAYDSNLLLIALLIFTALLSMFISNTATTAMAFGLIGPILLKIPKEHVNLKKSIALGIAYSANIGGIATLIGTPPNLVASGVLDTMGYHLTFLNWLRIGLPISILLLVTLYFVLNFIFPIKNKIRFKPPRSFKLKIREYGVLSIFGLTVLLWLTEGLHGYSSSQVIILPILLFSLLGFVMPKDLKKINWEVLLLIAGGLFLGNAIVMTELDQFVVNLLPVDNLNETGIIAILLVFVIIISNFISNTASANLIVPIAVSITQVDLVMSAILVAIGASMAMSLPVATPPNAIAYQSGFITKNDFIKVGTIVSIAGVIYILILKDFLFGLLV